MLSQLAMWKEFFVGDLDDEANHDEVDSFSLFPLEELYWRNDWRQTGFFAVASFFVGAIDTSIGVGAKQQQLGLWRDEEATSPRTCPRELSAILEKVEEHPDAVAEYLKMLESAADAAA